VRGLLAAANVPGPYVLAGHSVGGTYALAYAMDYPKDVAGVALIDSATPYQFDLPTYPGFYSMWRRASALLPTLARAGVNWLVRSRRNPFTDKRVYALRAGRLIGEEARVRRMLVLA
jgi:pimeloyl-ACP methyl ester carboxylesterase